MMVSLFQGTRYLSLLLCEPHINDLSVKNAIAALNALCGQRAQFPFFINHGTTLVMLNMHPFMTLCGPEFTSLVMPTKTAGWSSTPNIVSLRIYPVRWYDSITCMAILVSKSYGPWLSGGMNSPSHLASCMHYANGNAVHVRSAKR